MFCELVLNNKKKKKSVIMLGPMLIFDINKAIVTRNLYLAIYTGYENTFDI